MTKTDNNQGVMTRTGSTNASKRTVTLNRQRGGILCQAMYTLLASLNTAGQGMTAIVEELRTMIVFLATMKNSPIIPLGIHCLMLTLTVSTQDLELLTNSNGSFTINLTGSDPSETGATSPVGITFAFQDGPQNLLRPIKNVSLAVNSSVEISVETTGLAGHVDIVTNTTNNFTNTKESFVRVTVMKSETIELVSTIIGWIYFVAWSVSFWPQIVENFRRKSVIGLNFDFLSLNLIGFTLYGCFNVALFWVGSIQEEYYTKHPRGVLPVTPPDVFFPIHAVFATSITIFQCFIFERGNQKVSKGCLAILLGISIF